MRAEALLHTFFLRAWMFNRLKIGSKIGASFAVGLAMLAAIGVISYRTTTELIEHSRKEKHTYQVLGQIDNLNSEFQSVETWYRGYIITGETRSLNFYNDAIKSLNKQIEELERLVSDNPNQQRRIDVLQSLIAQRLDILKQRIDVRRSQGFEAAQKQILTDPGRQLTDSIQRISQQLEAEEYRLLRDRSQQAQISTERSLATIVYGLPLFGIIIAVIGYLVSRNISRPLAQVSHVADRIADGDFSVSLPKSDRIDEIGVLTRTFNEMIANLRDTKKHQEEQNWLQSNIAKFTQTLQGYRDLSSASRLIMSQIAPMVGAQHGVFYIMDTTGESAVLKLLSSYAYRERKHLSNQFSLGEGLVGQCALEKQRILLTEVPNNYIRINSGLGDAPPLNIVVLPILFENEVNAVIELASFQRFSEQHLTFLEQVSETLGVILNTITADMLTQELLKQSQSLAEELQSSNQRLEEKAQALQQSELQLTQQQEELKQSNEELQQLNEELEEKAELLELRRREVEDKNEQIERSRLELEKKAQELSVSSKYKSEFLANMSHELRTPLNSLLILARLLADNNENNLTDKQIEYSRTIYTAGTDLLELINDILDLAKIESGTLGIEIQEIVLTDLQDYIERSFRQVAANKELNFIVELDSNLPGTISTDPKRLQQILKNLLANAFKFTERGSVELRIAQVASAIAFAVSDTGIGIPTEKQQIIFEAFQQVDGTTSRKYGGTGLGLSISRELAHLLGGRIQLQSKLGTGSTFTLYLPLANKGGVGTAKTPSTPRNEEVNNYTSVASQLEERDDRENIEPGDRVLLVIEDDDKFARILQEMAQQQGFKVIVSNFSKQGLALAQQYQPNAIMLDINMPEMDGWTVLDRLKHDPNTRHIPVHILSVDDRQQRGLELGAIAYLQKPVSKEALIELLANTKAFIERKVRNLLVIEDDPVQARGIIELIGNGDVQSYAASTGSEALALLSSTRIDCIVLDLGLPDMTGLDLIEQIRQSPNLSKIPIVIYTGKEISRQEETQLRRLAETIIIKDARSPERLLDETALFLHRVQANLPQPKQQMLEQSRQIDSVLADKKILIVDDDVRNIFALTSLLESYQMEVLFAENGADGITTLQENPEINIVLMDVMMPEMDGYETTRAIRNLPQFRSLPIIALTAKAMQGDREKCIEAGASDYITKPVENEQLLSLLRVWLYR